MIEKLEAPFRVDLVEGDDNARVILDANDNIVCLTSTKYCDQLVDALNVGVARMAVS